MESLGQYLRTQRGAKRMSLEELATRTRICLGTLEALERDDYSSMPAEVTVKGFLRAYVRCLELDEAAVMERYRNFAAEYFKTDQESEAMTRVVTSTRHNLWQNRLMAAGLGVAGLTIIISVPVLWGSGKEKAHPTAITAPLELPLPVTTVPLEESQLVPSAAPSEEEAPALHDSSVPSDTTPPKEAQKSHRVVLTANEQTWVQAVSESGEVREALMQVGERIEWSVNRAVRLTIGNAGGVSVEFDGEPVSGLGKSGRVRTIVLPEGSVVAAVATRKPAVKKPDPSPAVTNDEPAANVVKPAKPAGPRDGPGAVDPAPPALTSPNEFNRVPLAPH